MKIIKNPDAEKIANEIAANWDRRNEIYMQFVIRNPDLKKWEGNAIGARATYLYQQLINSYFN